MQMLSTIIILTTPLRELFKMTTSKLRRKTRKIQKQAKLIHSLWILASFNYSSACSEMFQRRYTSLPTFSLSHLGHVCSVSEVQFFIWNTWYVIHSLGLMHKFKRKPKSYITLHKVRECISW